MVIDTSALMAILFDEPERGQFLTYIRDDPVRFLSAATLIESSIVFESRKGPEAGNELDNFVRRSLFDIVPVDRAQAEAARQAYRRYGKGRHPAGLNFGDCFAYALARVTGEPLLFKGADFGAANIEAVDREAKG
jgi:ribonuclease VapC